MKWNTPPDKTDIFHRKIFQSMTDNFWLVFATCSGLLHPIK